MKRVIQFLAHPIIFSGLASLSILHFPAAAAGDAPAEDEVWLSNIVLGGSGCPDGTERITNSPHNRSGRQFDFDGFFAEVAEGRTMDTRFCQINATGHVPSGWQYALARVRFQGHAFLEAGTAGTIRLSQYITGDGRTSTFEKDFNRNGNGLADAFRIDHEFNRAGVIWSPCGMSRALNIKLQIQLTNKYHPESNRLAHHSRRNPYGIDNAFGFISINRLALSRDSFHWRRCGKGPEQPRQPAGPERPSSFLDWLRSLPGDGPRPILRTTKTGT